MHNLLYNKDIVTLEKQVYNGFGELVNINRDGYETHYTYRPDGLRHGKHFADGTATTHILGGILS